MALRQGFNSVTLVGTLKDKVVKEGVNDMGEKTLSLMLEVEHKENDRVHNNKVNLWAKESGKLYKGYRTVADEYVVGERVKIKGSLELNQYISKQDGTLKEGNKIKGIFVERVKENVKDGVEAVVECVVKNVVDEMSNEGKFTGRKRVELLHVGYGEKIHAFKNVFVEAELAPAFCNLYTMNSTGKLFMKIDNYVEVKEVKDDNSLSAAFGVTLNHMPDSVVTSYKNEIIIVGGDRPEIANKYTLEQINDMKNLKDAAELELLKTPSTPNAEPNGFGTGATGFITDNDIPF